MREVREIICRERERGRVVFFSSHVLSEVERTADRVGIMQHGRLVLEGSVADVLQNYSSLEEAFVAVTGQPAAELRQ
jgi:ABC-2 type transport system ATP-binding protein